MIRKIAKTVGKSAKFRTGGPPSRQYGKLALKSRMFYSNEPVYLGNRLLTSRYLIMGFLPCRKIVLLAVARIGELCILGFFAPILFRSFVLYEKNGTNEVFFFIFDVFVLLFGF